MRYILSLLSLILIGVGGFQLSTVSAVASTKTVSAEATIVAKKMQSSTNVELRKFKRALTVIKTKIGLLDTKIKKLKVTLDSRVKKNLPVLTLEKQINSLMDEYNTAQEMKSKIEKKIQETASGIISKI